MFSTRSLHRDQHNIVSIVQTIVFGNPLQVTVHEIEALLVRMVQATCAVSSYR